MLVIKNLKDKKNNQENEKSFKYSEVSLTLLIKELLRKSKILEISIIIE